MEKLSKKTTYIGAGMGMVLFALLGLLPGSLLGGVMGLNIVGTIFGYPVTAGILQRMIVGITVAGIIFVAGTAVTGWLLGTAADTVREHMHTAHANTK